MADGGGSITLRVALAGAPEVKAALASLGPAGAQALRQIDQAAKSPSATLRVLNAAGKEVTSGMEEMAGKAGTFGAVLTAVGPAGLAAAAGVGAVIATTAGLVVATTHAMEFGEALETAAARAGVGVETLQTYRYAADQTGVSTEGTDKALAAFTVTLGRAEDGSKRALKYFQALGISQEQLRSFKSVDDALDATVDKITGLGSASERAGIAKGLGLTELTPLLQESTAKVEALRAKALDLGVVMDERVVKSLADTQKGFKEASQVISVQFMTALTDVAPLIVQVMQLLAGMVRELNDFMSQFKSLETRGSQALRDDQRNMATQLNRLLPDLKQGSPAARTLAGHLMTQIEANHAELVRRAADESGNVANNRPSLSSTALAGGGGNKKGPQDQSQQVIDAANQSLAQSKTAELQAQLSITSDVQDRFALESEMARDEHAAADAAVDRKLDEDRQKLAQGKITQAAFDQASAAADSAKSANAIKEHYAQELLARQEVEAMLTQQGDLDNEDIQARIAMASAQLAITTNMASRRTLALQIYDLEQQQKEAQLKLTLAKQQEAGDAAGATLTQKQLANLAAQGPVGRVAVSNANPIDAWNAYVQKMKQDLPTLSQEWAQMKADGVDAFNQSLFDSEGRLQSLGSIMHSVFSKMLVDLEQYLLKQAEIGIFGGGSGGSGGGGGGILGAIFGGLFGGGGGAPNITAPNVDLSVVGFAGGGRIVGPGSGTSDSVLIAASNGESIVNAAATQRFGALIDAMNSGRPLPIPRFASGGMVGGHGASALFGSTTNHWHIDRSIHAPGADAAALQRVANRQEEILKGEPERVVGYVVGMKKVGFVG